MSITSLSFTFVNTYAPQSAKPAAATERQAPPAPDDAKACEEQRPGGRQHRLVEAIMSALRELGVGTQSAPAPAPIPDPAPAPAGAAAAAATPAPVAAAAAPATQAAAGTSAAAASAQGGAAQAVTASGTTAASATDAPAQADASAPATATAAQPATDPAATVESAVHEFAHELFHALRQLGRDGPSDEGSGPIQVDGGHRRSHDHHFRREHAYGDMSQRLEALSQTLGAQAPTAAGGNAQPSPAVSSSLSITVTIQDGQPDAPVQASTAAAPAQAASTGAAPAAATGQAQNSANHPLLEAFSKLFNALEPQSTATSEAGMAAKLRTFLQTLAQAVRPEAMNSVQSAQVGGLVNVTA